MNGPPSSMILVVRSASRFISAARSRLVRSRKTRQYRSRIRCAHRRAPAENVAVFHQVPAKSVDALGALPHQEISGAKHDAVRLLLFALDRNEAHARPLGRFTDRLCIGGIVLLPLDERLDVGWRDQADMMAQLSDFTRPVVRAGAGFHRDDAPRLRC